MNYKDIIEANKDAEPETYEAVYGKFVEDELKKRGYNISKIQAITNNYLDEPANPERINEFHDLQKARRESKVVAKEFSV